jgi:predicted DsbA family dithiol-disulfide isomerase
MAPEIEVFADVGCPFTHVGLRRFVERRDADPALAEVRLRVRSWPLEVVNGRPLDPDFIAEEVDEIREQVAGDLFRAFDPAAFPATSLPAMALAAVGYGMDLATGEAISLELRDLLFERGRDVADIGVLTEVADRHGVAIDLDDPPVDLVLADHAEGEARGVQGSPHFFTPAGAFFCPSLDISRDADGHLRITADPVGFEQFLDSCFA